MSGPVFTLAHHRRCQFDSDRLTVATFIMRIEFDPAKDASNRAKHGVSLASAGELDWETALVWTDDRFEYNELRMIALAPKSHILYYVALVAAATYEESLACAGPTVER